MARKLHPLWVWKLAMCRNILLGRPVCYRMSFTQRSDNAKAGG